MGKVCAKMVPRLLSNNQKELRSNVCEDLLKKIGEYPEFLGWWDLVLLVRPLKGLIVPPWMRSRPTWWGNWSISQWMNLQSVWTLGGTTLKCTMCNSYYLNILRVLRDNSKVYNLRKDVLSYFLYWNKIVYCLEMVDKSHITVTSFPYNSLLNSMSPENWLRNMLIIIHG